MAWVRTLDGYCHYFLASTCDKKEEGLNVNGTICYRDE